MKRRILLIGMSNNVGGIETYLYNLVNQADRSVFSFDFLYTGFDKMAFEDEVRKLGCNVYKISLRSSNRKKHIEEMKRIIFNDYDVIHINLVTLSWYDPIVISSKTNSKIIVHSHSSGIEGVGLLTKMLIVLGKLKTKNIECIKLACSKSAGDYMFGKQEYTVVYNGISFEAYKYSITNRNNIRKEFSIQDDEIVIGAVAAFLPVKNHSYLIKVFKEFNNLNRKSKLLLVGDGNCKEDIIKLVKEEKLENNVVFAGIRKDVEKFYSAFDIFINTSIKEGFPISCLEAQVNGLNCYISNGVSKEIDVSNNVVFFDISEDPKEVSNLIFKTKDRDDSVTDKISSEYNSAYCFNKIFRIYNY